MKFFKNLKKRLEKKKIIKEHSQECVDAYNRLANNEICKFYLNKIPKYCAVSKILWIEAGVMEDNKVRSFRINYYDESLGENIDTKVSFHRYGHHSMELSQFDDFMKYLSVALGKRKFVYVNHSFDNYGTGFVYDRKYARRILLV